MTSQNVPGPLGPPWHVLSCSGNGLGTHTDAFSERSSVLKATQTCEVKVIVSLAILGGMEVTESNVPQVARTFSLLSHPPATPAPPKREPSLISVEMVN